MDVHVNRMPVGGRVTNGGVSSRAFLPAYKREAGDLNEYTEVWSTTTGRPIVVRQIVGILARRIVCRVKEGDEVARRRPLRRDEVRLADGRVPAAGQHDARCKVGDRVVGGVTVIADAAGRLAQSARQS